jgi:hypothetical protein
VLAEIRAGSREEMRRAARYFVSAFKQIRREKFGIKSLAWALLFSRLNDSLWSTVAPAYVLASNFIRLGGIE